MENETATQNASAVTTDSAPVTTEETTVTTTEEQTTDISAADDSQNTEITGSEPEKSKAVKELIAVRKRAQEAEKEAAYYKGLAEGSTRSTATTTAVTPVAPVLPEGPPPEPAPAKKLNIEDFGDDENAWGRYEAAQEQENIRAQRERDTWIKASLKWELQEEQRQAARQATVATAIETYTQRLNKAIETDPELNTIVANWDKPGPYQMPITPVMQEVIVKSEKGPELIRHLFNNKHEAVAISKMEPLIAAMALGQIVSEMKARPVEKPTRISSAPEPITTVTPQGAPQVFDPQTASTKEYYQKVTDEYYRRTR